MYVLNIVKCHGLNQLPGPETCRVAVWVPGVPWDFWDEAGLCAQQMDEIGAKLGEQPRSLGDKWDVE